MVALVSTFQYVDSSETGVPIYQTKCHHIIELCNPKVSCLPERKKRLPKTKVLEISGPGETQVCYNLSNTTLPVASVSLRFKFQLLPRWGDFLSMVPLNVFAIIQCKDVD